MQFGGFPNLMQKTFPSWFLIPNLNHIPIHLALARLPSDTDMEIETGQFDDAPEDLLLTTQEASDPLKTHPVIITTASLVYHHEEEPSEDESDVSKDDEDPEDDFFEQDLDVVNGQDWETLAGGKYTPFNEAYHLGVF
jgi:hypothetical protein